MWLQGTSHTFYRFLQCHPRYKSSDQSIDSIGITDWSSEDILLCNCKGFSPNFLPFQIWFLPIGTKVEARYTNYIFIIMPRWLIFYDDQRKVVSHEPKLLHLDSVLERKTWSTSWIIYPTTFAMGRNDNPRRIIGSSENNRSPLSEFTPWCASQKILL